MTLTFGVKIAVSADVPEAPLNQLFAALFLTQLFVFFIGNYIAADPLVLQHSARIALICAQAAAVFYMASRILRSVPWGLFTTYGLILLAAYSRFSLRDESGFLVGTIGLVYALRFLRISKAQIPAIFLMAAIASLAIWGTRSAYTSFDMVPRLHAGDVHQDTLFHASIAAMIKNYGTVSTGLHGLVETPYHALSHALMAGISVLSGQSVIETYGVATWLLFAPVLILAITYTCTALHTEQTLSSLFIWFLIALVLLFTPRLFDKWAVWDSYFVSESYLVSLGLLMLSLPVIFKQRLTVFDLAFVLIAGLLISSAKATVGLIYAGLWLTRVLFFRGDRPAFDVIGFGLTTAAVSALILASAQAHSSAVTINPFHFLSYATGGHTTVRLGEMMRNGTPIVWNDLGTAVFSTALFFIFHFLFTWIAVGTAAFRFGVRRIAQDPITVYSCAAAAAGILAIACFEIPGGALYYISNVAFFVAMPSGVAYAVAALPKHKITRRLILAFLLIIAMIGSASTIRSKISHANVDSSTPKNQLVQALSTLGSTSSLEVVYRYKPKNFSDLPVQSCTAQPFFFPAVSERVWVDIIRPQNNCEFSNYSYEQYGLRPDHQKVIEDPRLLSGMKVVDFELQQTLLGHADK